MRILLIVLVLTVGIAILPVYLVIANALFVAVPFPDFTARLIGISVYLLLVYVLVYPLYPRLRELITGGTRE